MTRERALEIVTQKFLGVLPEDERIDVADLILAAVAEDAKEADAIIRIQASLILLSVAEEREACAEIAESWGESLGGCKLHRCDEAIAGVIRARRATPLT